MKRYDCVNVSTESGGLEHANGKTFIYVFIAVKCPPALHGL